MKELLKFNHNQKEYCLLKNNGELQLAKKEKDKVSFDLNREERLLLLNVVTSFIPTSDLITLYDLNKDGKKFKHYFDRKRNWHLFYEYKDANLVMPNQIDLIAFNKAFNFQDTMLYKKNSDNKSSTSNFIKRIARFGKKNIVVIVAASIGFTIGLTALDSIKQNTEESSYTISYDELATLIKSQKEIIESTPVVTDEISNVDSESQTEESLPESIFEDEFEDETNSSNYDDYTTSEKVELIVKAIKDNPNLKEEEKKFFLSAPKFFYDNVEYMNLNYVLETMKNLKIEYIPESHPIIGGSYSWGGEDKYIIKIYNATNFYNTQKVCLSHEFLHSFTYHFPNGIAGGINELTNIMMNNEYFGPKYEFNPNFYDAAHDSTIRYAYLLTEIIGSDKMRTFALKEDSDILYNALLEIYPDEEKISNIIEGLSTATNGFLNEMDQEVENEIIKNIEIDLLFFYEKKYQRKISEEDYMFYIHPYELRERICNEVSERYECAPEDVWVIIENFKYYFNTENTIKNDLRVKVRKESQSVDDNFLQKHPEIQPTYKIHPVYNEEGTIKYMLETFTVPYPLVPELTNNYTK